MYVHLCACLSVVSVCMTCQKGNTYVTEHILKEERTAPPALRTGAAEKAEAPAMAAQRMAARSIASKTDWFSFLPRLYESIFLTKNLGPPEGKLQIVM